jgi:hypothetical protein
MALRLLEIHDLVDNFLDNNESIRLPMLTVHFSSRWRLGSDRQKTRSPKK